MVMNFESLLEYLAPKLYWDEENKNTWTIDLFEQPELTIQTLKALSRSWYLDRYGDLDQEDWRVISEGELSDD